MHLFYLLLLPVAVMNNKARLWVTGRIKWRMKLGLWNHKGSPTFWFHAASLGEFEQGLPVMEEIKQLIPGCRILLTFFSPSGYEIRKNYTNADLVCYLPLDTRNNARDFINLAKPDAVFFIKYEFWYFYLNELQRKGVPAYLISGIFRPDQIFFRFYGKWFSNQLRTFRHLFLQDKASSDLLTGIGIKNITIAGDTRFDRVKAIAANARSIEIARAFSEGRKCIVAGSTWPADEMMLARYINESGPETRFIIAPHEIETEHINRLTSLIRKDSILFSEASVDLVIHKQVLIINNIGMLSSLYQYGYLAYIGGGFGKGIHNTLEAAVFGIPVIFGPNFRKFREAGEMVTAGCAFSVGSSSELKDIMNRLINMPEFYSKSSSQARNYTTNNTGATDRILQQLKNDLLLHV
jgi:3-deoxy-D-manno-octulosonic-acid transferase